MPVLVTSLLEDWAPANVILLGN